MANRSAQHVLAVRYFVKVERRKRVPLEPPAQGFTTVHDGWKEHEVEVEVNLEGLAARLGWRAVRSSRGKATACNGLVIVRDLGYAPWVRDA